MAFGLYIHIPYCRSRCRYCDFYTQGGGRAVPDAYIAALLRDLAAMRPGAEEGDGKEALRPRTVYFGGGTPGLLTGAQVGRILRAANPLPGAEVTLETNPDLATPESLAAWRAAGVNRLSLGVQTARDSSLKTLGRLHTAADSHRALANARAAGFENISGDVMLALPHYSRAELDETLDLLLQGGAKHVSAYLLKIEPGTAFGRRPPKGLPGPDEAADFYLYAAEQLQAAGLKRYELSNFALPGFEGRHNLLYWNCEQVLGLGAGAYSLMGGWRFHFGGDTAAYIAGTLQTEREGPDDAEDYIMLRLRLSEGLDPAALHSRYGVALGAAQLRLLAQLEAAGYVQRTQAGAWALTGPGLMVENAILARLL